MSIKDQAEEIVSNLTDKLGEADTLIGEAAAECAGLAKLFQSAGTDYVDEAVEATVWAQQLASLTTVSDVMAEMEGDEKVTPDDDDFISITTTVREAKLVSKVLQFVQQLDSSDFDAETLASASLTYQIRVG